MFPELLFFPLSQCLNLANMPSIPPNCSFQIDDAESEWVYTQPFNYIHGRAMCTCFKDPLAIFRKPYAALAPGGWFEMQEIDAKIHSTDGTLDGTALEKVRNTFHYWQLGAALHLKRQWNDKCIEGARLLGGKNWRCATKYAGWFKDAGFVSIIEKQFYWPTNRRTRDWKKLVGRISRTPPQVWRVWVWRCSQGRIKWPQKKYEWSWLKLSRISETVSAYLIERRQWFDADLRF